MEHPLEEGLEVRGEPRARGTRELSHARANFRIQAAVEASRAASLARSYAAPDPEC